MFGTDPQTQASVARERRQKVLIFLAIALIAAGALFWIMSS